MSDSFERFRRSIAGLAMAQREFESPYAAGYDAGVNGPNEANCHFAWFGSAESMREWERGKRAALKDHGDAP